MNVRENNTANVPEKFGFPVPSRPVPVKGRAVHTSVDSPSLIEVHHEVRSILLGGLEALPLNDFGRPWPQPRGDLLVRLVATHDPDLCLKAAREAGEIVQAQDRAPNITSLFAKKLGELAEVRVAVRESLEAAS